MAQFDATLAAAFELDPARMAAATTDLVVDRFDCHAGSMGLATLCACFGDSNSGACSVPPPQPEGRATSCACFGDGSVSPCSAPPLRPED
jgi:hypothetical protein